MAGIRRLYAIFLSGRRLVARSSSLRRLHVTARIPTAILVGLKRSIGRSSISTTVFCLIVLGVFLLRVVPTNACFLRDNADLDAIAPSPSFLSSVCCVTELLRLRRLMTS